MGTQLGKIIIKEQISIKELSNKRFVVDAYNILYQFLSIIRQQDGALLRDSKMNVTSHLSGLFFRSINLMKNNLKLAFVFDGEAPKLKTEERLRRKELKQSAQRLYEQAQIEGDIELMKKYASRTSKLTSEMVDEAKELIEALGLPVVQAPSEGEAQAAFMVNKGDCYGLISQDTDGLLFGSPRIIRNLSISGRRRKTGTSSYESISPEIIYLDQVLKANSLDLDQLIVIAMLCGTDFNVGGVKGIGPVKGLNLIKKFNKDFDSLFNEAKWHSYFKQDWKTVFATIKNMPTTEDYDLNWTTIDKKKIINLLVDRHEFSKVRILNAMEELTNTHVQKGLDDFF